MGFICGRLVGLEAAAVVPHLDTPLRPLLDLDPHFPCLRVLAHVRQRLLHHVQHLNLHVGRQRHALTFHCQVRDESRLVFKHGQRGAQRGRDVFAVGART